MWLASGRPLIIIYESRKVRWSLLPESGLVRIEVVLEVLLRFMIKEGALLMHLIYGFKLVLEVLLVLRTLPVVDIMSSLLSIKGL